MEVQNRNTGLNSSSRKEAIMMTSGTSKIEDGEEKSEKESTKETKTINVGREPTFLPNMGNNWLTLLLEWTIPCDGEITSWEYFPRDTKVPANVSVWRKTEDDKHSYKIIGVNELPPAESLTLQVVEINSADRIQCKKDDIVGAFYSTYNINGSIACALENQGLSEKELSSVLLAEVFEEEIDVNDVVNFGRENMELCRRTLALTAKITPDVNKLEN